ncbi:hypothetical protein O181_023100 [Austropuccinia psidii MF-1]|uniref:Uncharacterized protein n=1 Tax=Austropuccinia psidii MF-1 TaxID=1389203 RepID=A0A9Q3GYR6_9BASI|nr:hypothetical protein [Austropuccinia psidii MF-1]
MEHEQQEVQLSFTMGRTWRRLPGDIPQIDTLQGPDGNNQTFESQKAVQAPGGVSQTDSPVSSNHPGTSRSVAKSHHSSQSQVVSRRREGSKGENKTSFNQRKKE